MTKNRRYLRDDCKHLGMKQVRELLKHDGLGASCEYDIEALRMRYNDLGHAQAAKVGNEWDRENGRGNAAPGDNTHVSDNARALLDFMGKNNLTANDVARIMGVTASGVRYWMRGQREIPNLVMRVIDLINQKPKFLKYFI